MTRTSGAIGGKTAYPRIANPRGLRRWKAAYDACLFVPAIIDVRATALQRAWGWRIQTTSSTMMCR